MSDWLDQLIGDWTYEGDSVPVDPDHHHTGNETVVRRGAWIIIESDDQTRFQLAFDPDSGRVTGDFVSWRYPTLWTYDGAVEGGRLVLNSRGPRFDGKPGETDYQDIWEIVSDDERKTRGRLKGDDGQWSDFNITRYRRKALSHDESGEP